MFNSFPFSHGFCTVEYSSAVNILQLFENKTPLLY